MNLFVDALIGFLPAGVANMTPVIIAKVPTFKHWTSPVDSGKSWRGKRLLGDHKTWRGLISGTIIGTVFGAILYSLYSPGFVGQNHVVFAFTISFGALLGDMIKSFFKRQIGVKSGKSWFPFDQTDYIIGGLVFISIFSSISVSEATTIFAIYFGLHLSVSYIGYTLGLKDEPI